MRVVLLLLLTGCAAQELEFSSLYEVTHRGVKCEFETDGYRAHKVYQDHLETCERAGDEVD